MLPAPRQKQFPDLADFHQRQGHPPRFAGKGQGNCTWSMPDGTIRRSFSRTAAVRLIDEVIGTAGGLAEKNQNRLVIEVPENVVALTADSMRLKQILLNLLSNACKFTKEGEVTLRGFVEVDARNVLFCRLSRHGQNCSRHHRENAEQGVAGLAHSPLRSIRFGPWCGSKSPRSNEPYPLWWQLISSCRKARRAEPGRQGTLQHAD